MRLHPISPRKGCSCPFSKCTSEVASVTLAPNRREPPGHVSQRSSPSPQSISSPAFQLWAKRISAGVPEALSFRAVADEQV